MQWQFSSLVASDRWTVASQQGFESGLIAHSRLKNHEPALLPIWSKGQTHYKEASRLAGLSHSSLPQWHLAGNLLFTTGQKHDNQLALNGLSIHWVYPGMWMGPGIRTCADSTLRIALNIIDADGLVLVMTMFREQVIHKYTSHSPYTLISTNCTKEFWCSKE